MFRKLTGKVKMLGSRVASVCALGACAVTMAMAQATPPTGPDYDTILGDAQSGFITQLAGVAPKVFAIMVVALGFGVAWKLLPRAIKKI